MTRPETILFTAADRQQLNELLDADFTDNLADWQPEPRRTIRSYIWTGVCAILWTVFALVAFLGLMAAAMFGIIELAAHNWL